MSDGPNLPSGSTWEVFLRDLQALTRPGVLTAAMPADIALLVTLGEQLVQIATAALLAPGGPDLLRAEVSAEQAAGDAAETAKFGAVK